MNIFEFIILCLHEGIWTGEHLVDGDPKVWRRLWNVNVVATSLCTQFSIKLMIEKGT